MRSGIGRFAVAPSDATYKNRNIDTQLQSISCVTAPKMFWKIYFLYDFWCAQTCSFRTVLGLPIRNLTIAVSAITSCGKNSYRCTSTFSALNYCSGIFFKSVSYLYEVVRTNFYADFWTFRNFDRNFANLVAPASDKKENCVMLLNEQSIPKKGENASKSADKQQRNACSNI